VARKGDGARLLVRSSPHLYGGRPIAAINRDVVLALVPAVAAGTILFGPRALALVAVGSAAAVAAEAVYQRATRRPVTVRDWSAALTGLLLALNLPPRAPLWLAAVGAAFAIIVVKQLFGGLGSNFVNPALAARGVLLAAWPVPMTAWTAPFQARTMATPLALLKAGAAAARLPSYLALFLGVRPGCAGETSVLALLAGAAYLLARRVIDWRIPAAFLGTLAVATWAVGGRGGAFTGDPLFHVLAGGATLGAFFMATDYVTSPVTHRGRVIFGAGCGFITALIRLFGGYPEGVSYAILLMNLVAPLLDRVTAPRPFGTRPEGGQPEGTLLKRRDLKRDGREGGDACARS